MFVKTRAHLESITVFQIHALIFALTLLSLVQVSAAQASTPPNTIRLKSVTVDTVCDAEQAGSTCTEPLHENRNCNGAPTRAI